MREVYEQNRLANYDYDYQNHIRYFSGFPGALLLGPLTFQNSVFFTSVDFVNIQFARMEAIQV